MILGRSDDSSGDYKEEERSERRSHTGYVVTT